MPEHLIDRVNELADVEGAEYLDDDVCPILEWEITHR